MSYPRPFVPSSSLSPFLLILLRALRGAVLLVFALLLGPSSHAEVIRGDADLNGRLQITDPIRILGHLFLGEDGVPCDELGDVNADGRFNIGDPVGLLEHLFRTAPRPDPLTPFEERLCVEVSQGEIELGMVAFDTPDADGNTFACATCHNLDPDDEAAFRRPGHSLHDALYRPSYKNGQLDHFLDAANVCRREWMVTSTWSENDEPFLNLVSFLHSLSAVTEAPALDFEITPPSVAGPSFGDAEIGCELFHTACVICHGNGALGTERAPSLVFDPENPFDADYIRARVRLSGNPESIYDGLTEGGVMPFWAADKLSDAEIEDLVAFVVARPVPVCRDVEPPPDNIVLRSGELKAESRGVRGLAEELSSGNFRIREFHFDGIGEDVRVWLFSNDNFAAGFAIGENLARPVPGWTGETLEVAVPDGTKRDTYDRLAIRSLPDGEIFAECALEPIGDVADGKVVRSGEFVTRFHGVAGTVEELDTRKFRFTSFNYDGAGIDTRVWLYDSADPGRGYEIGPSLLRPPPAWEDATFVVDIPAHLTPDMYDSVSIWCVPAFVSFGDALLLEK